MPLVVKSFDKYALRYYGGKPLQSVEVGADIDCYSGAARVGSIRFFGNGGSGTAPSQVLADGTLAIYYQMGHFNDVITFLRYEKPLSLVVNSDTGFGYVNTGALETVGEQEAV